MPVDEEIQGEDQRHEAEVAPPDVAGEGIDEDDFDLAECLLHRHYKCPTKLCPASPSFARAPRCCHTIKRSRYECPDD